MPRIRFFCALGLLIAGAAIATLGTPDPRVGLESLTELWSDTLRDTDQIGMKVTRVHDAEEMQIGADLARSVPYPEPQDRATAAYVDAVGQTVAQHVRRRGIQYQFHVVESPDVNAFALPGGHIYVTTGMLGFVESEAELAAILGHEISHVDLRHCIENYQYQAKLKKAGMPVAGDLAEIAHHLATFPFAHDQESDADAQGLRLSIESGYDPQAAPALFTRLKEHQHELPRVQATTPAGEVTQSAGEAIGSFFRSHPPSEERTRDLYAMVSRDRSRLQGKAFYVGRQNLRDRTAMRSRQYPGEYITMQ